MVVVLVRTRRCGWVTNKDPTGEGFLPSGDRADDCRRRSGVGQASSPEPIPDTSPTDDRLGLARESAELSWRELRRGVDRLDASTRPPQPSANGRPFRPYRVKP
jgi:hypothetical protein